ncbi:MAG TPA: alpha/beta fold hydrolase [Coleofasciculaceae cyanobacterium]|jgi:carboxylesterase
MLSNEPYYLKAGMDSDEAFLMLHGLGGGVYEMSPLARELHAAGHSVMAFNYPGHDVPAQRMPDSQWQDWYGSAETAYRELAAQHQHVSIIGFSTGCVLGLRLASEFMRHQPVHRLILLSPFLKVRMQWYYLLTPEFYVRRFGRMLRDVPRSRLPINDPEMERLARRSCYFQTFNLPSVLSALDLIEEVHPELPRIDTPTLIVQSRRDRIVCPSGAETLMQRLGSVHKQVHWLENSDHVLLLDTERETVTRHIRNFIDDTRPEILSAVESA